MNLSWPKVIFFLVGLFLAACSSSAPPEQQALDLSLAENQEPPSLSGPSPVVLESPTPQNQTVGVELLWQATAENVTTYHLYYGSDPEQLNEHVAIAVGELEKFEHPIFGPTFRYRLAAEATSQEVFFSLSAENSDGVSAKSAVVRVTPRDTLP